MMKSDSRARTLSYQAKAKVWGSGEKVSLSPQRRTAATGFGSREDEAAFGHGGFLHLRGVCAESRGARGVETKGLGAGEVCRRPRRERAWPSLERGIRV